MGACPTRRASGDGLATPSLPKTDGPALVRAFGATTVAEERRLLLRSLDSVQPEKKCEMEAESVRTWHENFEELRREIQKVSRECWEDREVALAAMAVEGSWLQLLAPELRGDLEVVKKAVGRSGYALQYASEACRSDRDVVLRAIARNDGIVLQFASRELRADREVVLEAVKKRGEALMFASEELRSERGVVLEAVKHDGRSLRFSSIELRADKEVVTAAVLDSGLALEHACPELQNDKEVVLAAVARHADAFAHASPELQTDSEVTVKALLQGRAPQVVLHHASPECQGDRDLVLLGYRSACTHPLLRSGRTRKEILDTCLGRIHGSQVGYIPMSEEEFEQASCSGLAVKGQMAPVVELTLRKGVDHSGDNDADGAENSFSGEATLLSGTTFVFEIPGSAATEDTEGPNRQCRARRLPTRAGPVVNDVAAALLAELPKHSSVSYTRHVYINLRLNDGSCLPLTPWDWNLPLASFALG